MRKPSPTGSDGLPSAIERGNQGTNGIRSKHSRVYMIVEELAHFAPSRVSAAMLPLLLGLGETGWGRRRSSHVPVAVLALAPTDLTVDSPKASALFDLLAPPLHMAGLGVVLP
jgi:hypothetical protein